MAIGLSLILAAAGAIIRFAVGPASRVAGTFVNWDIVGDILLVAGAAGVVASILWMAAATRRTTTGTTPREGSA
jgi:hypothetical protein